MTGITNPAIDEMPGPSIGKSSLDKKNRKKRAAKNLSPDLDMTELVVDPFIEAFYSKFMRKKKFKADNS
jgi:hypothetical protein